MKKMAVLFLCVLMIMGISSLCLAEEGADITPRADAVFMYAFPNILSSKYVRFQCCTYGDYATLCVASCWLEKLVDGEWETVCRLLPPAYVGYNTFSYFEEKDYSAYIGSGTYRVWATFDATGYRITRCSNERTF